jgi:lysophospholipase L1-like esterase/pimeloyl-ACP methyl ester carboxylesterase
MKKLYLYRLLMLFFMATGISYVSGQQPEWDNTISKHWDKKFSKVSIPSSFDSTSQHAWMFSSSAKEPQPLIVSLHTWSGDYNQEDPLAKETLLRNWNYIHPDFRGPNNRRESCGSEQVISDIRDAIIYASKHSNVDTTNVHIVGVSGGGYAAMMAYMKLEYPVKSFHSWVGISDLENWYWESKGRKQRYSTDLELVSGKKDSVNFEELKRRSPLHVPFKKVRTNDAEIHLYAGIHDGYTGSVPISHSIQFYNMLVTEKFPPNRELVLSDSIILSLITKRTNTQQKDYGVISDRKIHYKNGTDKVSLTIFEGTHEMLVKPALSLVISTTGQKKPLNILTIGDSNGAFDYGWPVQLEKLLPHSRIINKSIAGNTIGFDNLGNKELNTLRNIEKYIVQAYDALQHKNLDFIFLGLGTNDAKKIFTDSQKNVSANLSLLVDRVREIISSRGMQIPDICILIPPPIEETKADIIKYGGANSSLLKYKSSFKSVAVKEKTGVINNYILFSSSSNSFTTDGIHLNEPAQFLIAKQIVNYINKKITDE